MAKKKPQPKTNGLSQDDATTMLEAIERQREAKIVGNDVLDGDNEFLFHLDSPSTHF